jgi:hypothetical protein
VQHAISYAKNNVVDGEETEHVKQLRKDIGDIKKQLKEKEKELKEQ